MRAAPALLIALACSSAQPAGEPQLELRTRPTTDLDVIKGVITISAATTLADGSIGSGTVRFFSDVGELSAEEAPIDEFGKAEVTFRCIAGMHPYCDMQDSAEVSARWNPPGKSLTVTRKIPLRRPVATGFSGDGGSGTTCTSQNDCQQGLTCFESTCVGAGQLRFSLSWSVASDFDLHLLTPGGDEVFYANRRAGGAELDVDACVTTTACRPTNVENIFFRAQPPPGRYQLFVNNYNGRAAGPFRIVVSGGLQPNVEFTGSLPATPGAESMRFPVMR